MVQVIPRSDIGLKAPKSTTKFKNKPKGLAWHWEGGGTPEATLEDSKKTLRSVQSSHMNNKAEGYVDIAYNIAFDSLGNIFILRGWNVQGGANGTSAANASYVSAVYLSGPGEPFTDAAKEAARVIRGLADGEGIGSENRPHSSFKATSCPGPEITEFIKTLSGSAAPTPAPQPAPAPAPAPQPSVPAFPGYVRQFVFRDARNSRGGCLRSLRVSLLSF